jgi:hypothetical protein
MPPRARLRLTPIVQLERQLEFAGAEAVRRIVKAAEAATREVDRDGLLSEAWIVERLTGVKSRDAERAPVLVGQAVAMDLSALALRLSERAPLQPSDLPGGAVTLVHGANDLGVTVRSLQRWRRQGLAMVRVRTLAGVRTALSGTALSWCRERLLGSVASRRRDPVRRASVMAVAASEARAAEMLGDVPVGKRRLGPKLSRKIYEAVCGAAPPVAIDSPHALAWQVCLDPQMREDVACLARWLPHNGSKWTAKSESAA